MLFLLTLLAGQLPVQSGRGHVVGLFHFEKHRRRGTVLHGPERTGWPVSIRTVTLLTPLLGSVCVDLRSTSQSPFLGVGLDMSLLKLSLLLLGLRTSPVWVVPQLVLLQAHLCGKHGLAVGTAVTQLLSYGGLQTQI